MKWYDVNGKSSVTTYNYSYEVACVMFNLAALHSQAAFNLSSVFVGILCDL